jgi:hypothetical protein
MPEWLIIIAVFFIVTRLLRSRRHRLGMYRHPGQLRRARMRELRRARTRERHEGRERLADRPQPITETPEDALRRRYVDGSITVEEYEAQLDRLYRGETPEG